MANDVMMSLFDQDIPLSQRELKIKQARIASQTGLNKAIKVAMTSYYDFIHVGGAAEVKERMSYVADEIVATVKKYVDPTPNNIKAVRLALLDRSAEYKEYTITGPDGMSVNVHMDESGVLEWTGDGFSVELVGSSPYVEPLITEGSAKTSEALWSYDDWNDNADTETVLNGQTYWVETSNEGGWIYGTGDDILGEGSSKQDAMKQVEQRFASVKTAFNWDDDSDYNYDGEVYLTLSERNVSAVVQGEDGHYTWEVYDPDGFSEPHTGTESTVAFAKQEAESVINQILNSKNSSVKTAASGWETYEVDETELDDGYRIWQKWNDNANVMMTITEGDYDSFWVDGGSEHKAFDTFGEAAQWAEYRLASVKTADLSWTENEDYSNTWSYSSDDYSESPFGNVELEDSGPNAGKYKWFVCLDNGQEIATGYAQNAESGKQKVESEISKISKTAGDNPFAKKDDDDEDENDENDSDEDAADGFVDEDNDGIGDGAEEVAQALLEWQTASDEQGEFLAAVDDNGLAYAIYPYENSFYWQVFDPSDNSGAVLSEGTSETPETAQTDAESAVNDEGEQSSPFDEANDGDEDQESDDSNPFAKKNAGVEDMKYLNVPKVHLGDDVDQDNPGSSFYFNNDSTDESLNFAPKNSSTVPLQPRRSSLIEDSVEDIGDQSAARIARILDDAPETPGSDSWMF